MSRRRPFPRDPRGGIRCARHRGAAGVAKECPETSVPKSRHAGGNRETGAGGCGEAVARRSGTPLPCRARLAASRGEPGGEGLDDRRRQRADPRGGDGSGPRGRDVGWRLGRAGSGQGTRQRLEGRRRSVPALTGSLASAFAGRRKQLLVSSSPSRRGPGAASPIGGKVRRGRVRPRQEKAGSRRWPAASTR
jgi:hypothetical protein